MGLRKLNFNLMYFGFVLLRPPLFILVGAALLCTAINFFISPLYFEIWLGLLGLFALSFILIILTQSRQKGMGVALLYTPLVVMRQLRAIFKMKKATRSFMQTEHSKAIYIEDILKNEAGR